MPDSDLPVRHSSPDAFLLKFCVRDSDAARIVAVAGHGALQRACVRLFARFMRELDAAGVSSYLDRDSYYLALDRLCGSPTGGPPRHVPSGDVAVATPSVCAAVADPSAEHSDVHVAKPPRRRAGGGGNAPAKAGGTKRTRRAADKR